MTENVVGGASSRWLIVVGEQPLRRVETRGPLRLPGIAAGRTMHDDVGRWAGMHDVLRDCTGRPLGIRVWMVHDEAPRALAALERHPNVSHDEQSVSVWLGAERAVDAERSFDQSLSEVRLLWGGSVAVLAFELSHVADAEFRALLGEPPRA